MRQQHLCAPRVGLNPDARALLAALMAAAGAGRLTHTDARQAARLPMVAYADALGQLERAGILPRLFVTGRLVVFTVCTCAVCVRLSTGGAQ
jgi:hypothetical protein